MKKISSVILITLVFFQFSFAQEATVIWGKPFELQKLEGFMGIMKTSINGRVYGITGHAHLGSIIGSHYISGLSAGFVEPKIKMDYHIFKTTPDLAGIEKQVEITGDEDLVNQYIDAASIGDQLCVFISEYSKKLKSTEIICMVYDGDLNQKKTIGKIFTLTGNTETEISQSPDRKKIIVLSKSEITNKDVNMKVNAIVFDENLTQVWKKEIPYEVSGAATGQDALTVDNNGVMNFIAKQYNSDKIREAIKQEGKSTVNYKYVLYRNSIAGGIVKIELKYDNLFITDIKSFVSDKNILTCFALLSDKPVLTAYASYNHITSTMSSAQMKSGGNILGYGLIDVDAEGNVSYIKYNFIVNDLKKITAYMPGNAKPKDESQPSISNAYEIRDLYTQNDGSRIVTLEYFMPVSHAMSNQNYISYKVFDILVMKISVDDKLLFISSIPKRVAFNDAYMYEGHVSLLDEKGLHFIFIDTPANTYKSENTSGKLLTTFKGGNMYVVDLNTDDGTYKRKSIGSIDKMDILINTEMSTKIDNSRVFLIGLMSNALGKIDHYNFGRME